MVEDGGAPSPHNNSQTLKKNYMYYSVAILTPPYNTYTYALPKYWPLDAHGLPQIFRRGLRVAVPLGKGVRMGVLLDDGVRENPLDDSVADAITIKELACPLEVKPLLDEHYLALIQQLAVRHHRHEGDILRHILPASLRLTTVKLRSLQLRTNSKKARLLSVKGFLELSDAEKATLVQELVLGTADILQPKEDSADSEMCVLQVDPPWPVRPMAVKQIAVLEYLHERGSSNRRQLLRALGQGSGAALDSLVRHAFVSLKHMDKEFDSGEENLLPPPEQAFELSDAQKDALGRLETALDSAADNGAQNFLLYGVTGSGKTAVYLELSKLCLARGRSILLLAPEVALALKLKRDVALALPHLPLFLYHGYQNPSQREKLFRELAERDEACIVVGTRSALFLPLRNFGAVVLDEEHDSSFKQDEKLPYHAKEVALFRMYRAKGLVVLGSATPDMKTFYAAKQSKINEIALPSRVGGGTLPSISLVDIAGQRATESVLAPESQLALKETLARGEQAVILLNRRGYAPLMYCLDCQKVARCPHCEIALTYHKKRQRLLCHYCGYALPFPALCVHCKGMHFLPMGEGTERLTEYLATFSDGKILRLDRDSTRREGHMEAILESFARKESQILVGTQMLSKGHHFPEVTLALVVDGDLGLNTPDYRATERTFQLLVQSAGRAGRGKKAGQVLIQTRDVNHYCWKYIQNSDYEGFYTHEMARREKMRYPPFVNLALIRISFAYDFTDGQKLVNELGGELRKTARCFQDPMQSVLVLGPSPAPMALLRGQRRFHCLLKSQSWQSMRTLFGHVLQLPLAKKLKLSLDLDPLNMF